MGMYTEFHFNAELLPSVPHDEIVGVLNFMLGGEESDQSYAKRSARPAHRLFDSPRWRWMLQCDSYCFAADTHSTLRYDDIAGAYYLCVRCNLKDYGNEIELFVDWIRPYLCASKGDFLGFSRYEENEQPDLIYM